MRRFLALLLACGCSPSPAQKPPDNLQLPEFDASAAQLDAGPGPVSVTVFFGGSPEPGVLVAFQDAAGAVVGTATTDAKGTASKVLPAGSQVTVLLGSAATFLTVYTYVGVEPGDALGVIDPTGGASVTATIAALPANPPPATAYYLGYIGECATSFGQLPAAMFASPNCTGTGKFPLLVLAQGGSGPPSLGYAFRKDNTITDPDAGTTTLALSGNWSTTVGTWTIDASNAPTSAQVSASFAEVANGIPYASAGIPPTGFETHPGYADFVQSEVSASFPAGNFNAVELASIATRAPAPAQGGNVTIDLGQLLPGITSASADFTNGARPTVSWKTAGSLASADGTFVHLDCVWSDDASQIPITWDLVAPPSATSVQMPALPPEASLWTPTGPGFITTPTVVTVDGLGGYAQLRKRAAALPPPNTSVKAQPPLIPPLPKDGTVRMTLYGPSPA